MLARAGARAGAGAGAARARAQLPARRGAALSTSTPTTTTTTAVATGAPRALPYVADRVVRFTLVDYKGEARSYAGLSGQRLSEAAAMYPDSPLADDSRGGGLPAQRVNSATWTEDVFGEGPISSLAHVVFRQDWYAKLPAPMPHEAALLGDLDPADRTPYSRLATEIVLSKDLDGVVIYVPDTVPVDDLL